MSMQSGIESSCDFYAWECLTIKMPDRTVDFVIEDEKLVISLKMALEKLIMQ